MFQHLFLILYTDRKNICFPWDNNHFPVGNGALVRPIILLSATSNYQFTSNLVVIKIIKIRTLPRCLEF